MSSPFPKRKCRGSPGSSKEKYPSHLTSILYSSRLLKLLRERELGMGVNTNFPEKAYQMKIQDFERIRSSRFGNENETSHTVYFLRAGKTALIAVSYVEIKKSFFTAVAQLHYDLSRVVFGRTAYISSQNRVVDACQLTSDPDCFISVSFTKQCSGEVQVACGARRANNSYTSFKYVHPNEKAFWCCNGNQFTERFALGCDREMCLYSVNGLDEIISFPGNIYSLAYNRGGTVLHLGTEQGNFCTYDVRAHEIIDRVKVGSSLIDDVLLLSDEHDCIVSEVTGNLQKVDLRMNKIVQKFPGHSRRSQKIPVSVNERFGLLSATGADDMTRIWCLKTTRLLHTFGAPSTYPARSCLVPGCSRGVIHMVQDNYVHVYGFLR